MYSSAPHIPPGLTCLKYFVSLLFSYFLTLFVYFDVFALFALFAFRP